jgi:DHA1 family tetracycline resistance protein-like MFS transporter
MATANDSLLGTQAGSIQHAAGEEDDLSYKLRHRAMASAIFTTFVDSVMFSIVLPSLAIYVTVFVEEDDPDWALWVSLISAAHPFGQLIGSPLASFYFNSSRPTKECMCVFIGIFCIGALTYATAGSVGMLLFSRLLQGFGDANLTVCRAYVGFVANYEEKNKMMSLVSAGQGLGFLVGSTIGGLLGYIDTTLFGSPLDGNTAPGYFSFLVGILNIVVCWIYMMDYKGSTDKGPNSSIEAEPPNPTGILMGLFLFFLVISSFSVLLVSTTPYLLQNYSWSTSEIAWVFAGGAALGICGFISVNKLNEIQREGRKLFPERLLLLFGLLAAGFAMGYMGGFGVFQPSVTEWIIAVVFFFWLHPFAMACTLSVYSQIIGPHKEGQGKYMGYITMMGSFASIVSPLWAINFLEFESYRGEFTFFSNACLLLIGACMVLFTWKHLVPHPAELRKKTLVVQYDTFGEKGDVEL